MTSLSAFLPGEFRLDDLDALVEHGWVIGLLENQHSQGILAGRVGVYGASSNLEVDSAPTPAPFPAIADPVLFPSYGGSGQLEG